MPPAGTRRTRAVRAVEDVPLDGETAVKVDGRTSAARAARRVQAATGDPKVRLPEDKRAVESANGELVAAIGGQFFRLQESVGLMPLMEWAAAQDEIDMGSQLQLAGMLRLLKDLVDPQDWAEFRSVTREAKSDGDDFVGFINTAMEAISALPTKEPATS